MEVRFLQIFFIFTIIKQSFSLTIYCNIKNSTHFTENSENFECEIFNNLQIIQRNLQIDKILNSSNDTTEEIYEDYFENSNFQNISDVKFSTLITYNNTINFIPTNLHEFFPNLSLLAIVKSNLLEIWQKDLKNFPDLQGIWLPFNKIEVIEWHLFDYNPKLSQIILTENRIKIISSDAFNELKNLEHLDLLANVCINKFAASKEDVKKIIENLEAFCKYECNCENYFIMAFIFLAFFSAFILIYVLFK
ncbi:hypothetical protein PVAND_016001 [Polypedilum vanderplanki]|uniref:Leucine rich repeat protein n=1 Tax=Polypedilum vanderplanki TaxID=319348 RepID=A0A9J6BDV6_POLVA|nr:hypothetical protein PVAND_016001 [Polypedilum vanderplanki]